VGHIWKTTAIASASLLFTAPALAQDSNEPAVRPLAVDPIAPLAQPQPAPSELPPPLWSPSAVQVLLDMIEGIGAEGLAPTDYDPAGLSAAMRTGNEDIISAAATDRYLKLADDLAHGHVRGKDRNQWFAEDDKIDEAYLMALLRRALYDNNVHGSLTDLLPNHPQYLSLRAALARADKADTKTVNTIRLNMDRWRWLPRELGDRYIIVNVPSYYATLVENGATRWKTRAVAGAPKTQTPSLTAKAVGVVLNPTWEVPKSIWPEVAGKPGYVAVKGKNGKFSHWRQPAGPTNALGQLKFVMYNPQNIYLHDTNAKSRFNSSIRAASHGCIRTKDVVTLATMLLGDDGGEWTPDRVQETLASKKTVQANFVKPLPVYIVYFSMAATNDGELVRYDDIYKRDASVIAALLDHRKGSQPSQVASR
jgi:murein L,D-transpeptidase YcbB/YkuD